MIKSPELSNNPKKTAEGVIPLWLFDSMCCKSKKGEPRTVSSDEYEPLRDETREKMKQQSSKDINYRRKVVVEPVFGQIKNNGFRGSSQISKQILFA